MVEAPAIQCVTQTTPRGAEIMTCTCQAAADVVSVSPLTDYQPIILAGISVVVAAWGIRQIAGVVRMLGQA